MSKIERKKLVKGTKLQAEPIDDFFTAVNNEIKAIGTTGLDRDNISYLSSFHLKWTLSSILWGTTGIISERGEFKSEQAYCFPFILPETQDKFSSQITADSTYYTLKDIVMSLDQGDEPINWFPWQTKAGPSYTPQGTTTGDAGNYNFKLSIFKKTPWTVNNNITHWESEIASFNIPGTAFAVSNMALNPFVISDTNLRISPDSSYCAVLTFEGQTPSQDEDAQTNNRINNIQIDFRFITEIRQRDIAQAPDADPTGMANAPTLYKAPTSDNLSLGAINPGDLIQEDPLQTNIEKIDDKIEKKLSGGFSSTWAKPQAREQLINVQAYEAFNVQMFNNTWVYKDAGIDMYQMPYTRDVASDPDIVPLPGPSTANFEYVWDRAIIPITEPFEIHSIYLAWEQRDGTGPTIDKVTHEVQKTGLTFPFDMACEVVLHSGWNSDWYGTQSISYFAPPTNQWGTTNLVDQAVDPLLQNIKIATATLGEAPIRIVQIPLNYDNTGGQNSEGVGYYGNGIPVFVGRGVGFNSDSRNNVASQVGPVVPVSPATKGLEKCIEIKLGFLNMTAITNLEGEQYWANGPTAPGFNIIIIGKKSLVRSEW